MKWKGTQLTGASTTSSGQTLSQTFAYGPAANGAPLASESTQTPDFSAAIAYAYSPEGLLQSITYPSGRVVTYGYDGLDRVRTVSQTAPGGGTGGTVATVGYDPAWGLESFLQFASGASSVWTTQPDGIHLKQWSIQLPNGTKLDGDRLYNYDASKDALSQAGEWNLMHDSRGRLTSASAPTLGNYTANYGYDAFDNNTSASLSGATPPQVIAFSFPALPLNQTPSTSGGSSTGWAYDAAGEATNLGAAVGSSSVTGLIWDGLGRMSQVNAPGLTETEGYAPSGMRVRRDDSVAGLSRRYAYTSGGLLLGEYVPAAGGGWQWNRDVVYLGSQAIAEIDGNGMHELHSDHLGTPRVITTASGGTAVIEGRQNYGPYGETFPAMDSGYQPLTGYTGHIQTDPTGLIYMRGRFYTPIWHRFVNSDQGADPSTFNQMAYVGGSPMMGTDPSGMSGVIVVDQHGRVLKTFNDWADFVAWASGGGGDGYTFSFNKEGTSQASVNVTASPADPFAGIDASNPGYNSSQGGNPFINKGGGPIATVLPQRPKQKCVDQSPDYVSVGASYYMLVGGGVSFVRDKGRNWYIQFSGGFGVGGGLSGSIGYIKGNPWGKPNSIPDFIQGTSTSGGVMFLTGPGFSRSDGSGQIAGEVQIGAGFGAFIHGNLTHHLGSSPITECHSDAMSSK